MPHPYDQDEWFVPFPLPARPLSPAETKRLTDPPKTLYPKTPKDTPPGMKRSPPPPSGRVDLEFYQAVGPRIFSMPPFRAHFPLFPFPPSLYDWTPFFLS